MADKIFNTDILSNIEQPKFEPRQLPELPKREPIKVKQEPSDLTPALTNLAERYDVPLNILMSMAKVESEQNPESINIPALENAAMAMQKRLANGYSMEDAIKEHYAGEDRAQWGPKTNSYAQKVLNEAFMLIDQPLPVPSMQPEQSTRDTLVSGFEASLPQAQRQDDVQVPFAPQQQGKQLPQQEQQTAQPTQPIEIEQKGREWGEVFTDTLSSFGSGSGALVGSVGSLYGLITGDMDNELTRIGKIVRNYHQANKSDELKAKEQRRAQALENANGEWEAMGVFLAETITDPALFGSFLVEQIPNLVATGGVGRAAAIAVKPLAKSAAGKVGTGAAIGAGAALQGAEVGGEAYERIIQLTPEEAQYAANEAYQAMINDGVQPEVAKQTVALELSRLAALKSAAVSVATQALPSARTIERVLAGGQKAGGGAMKGAAKGFLGEGASEATEEVSGGLFANQAVQEVNPNQSLTEGLGERAAGGLLFAPFGGVAGAVDGRQQLANSPQGSLGRALQKGVDQATFDADAAARQALDPRFAQQQQAPFEPVQEPTLAPEQEQNVTAEDAAPDDTALTPSENQQYTGDVPKEGAKVSVVVGEDGEMQGTVTGYNETGVMLKGDDNNDYLIPFEDMQSGFARFVELEEDVAGGEDADVQTAVNEPATSAEVPTQEQPNIEDGVQADQVGDITREDGQVRVRDNAEVDGRSVSEDVPIDDQPTGDNAALTENEILGQDGKPKWFGSKPKATAFIEKRGLEDTHEVRKSGARWEIRAKQPEITQEITQPEPQQPVAEVQPDPQQDVAQSEKRIGDKERSNILSQVDTAIEKMQLDGAEYKGAQQAYLKRVLKFADAKDPELASEVRSRIGDLNLDSEAVGATEAETAQQPSAPAKTLKPSGRKEVVSTPSNQDVEIEYAVIDAEDLITSNDANGKLNPAYPSDLQPRDRGRAASITQINDIASKLNPRRLAESATTSEGAPMVAEDGVVESGNGRVLSIKKAYSSFGDKAQEYRQFLADSGYDIEGMAQPVLVRVRRTPMTTEQRIQYTRDSNERTTLGMSPAEQAQVDADNAMRVIDDYRGGDVNSAANRDFVRKFMGSIPESSRADLMDKNGYLSQAGKRRIQAAMLQSAYGDSDLVSELFESEDTDIKAIGGALLDASGQWAKMRSASNDGAIADGMDVTPQLMDAVGVIRRARAEGKSVAELVRQDDIFSGETNPITTGFVRIFYRGDNFSRARSRERVSEALQSYANQALETKADDGLFGDEVPPVRPNDILEKANERNVREESQAGSQAQLLPSYGLNTRGDAGLSRERQRSQPETVREPSTEAGESEPRVNEQKAQFADNKIFTQDKVEAARARIKSKLGQLNSGVDPELFVDGMTIAGAYIESGVRNFKQFAKTMVDDFGSEIKPYLLSFWEGARNYPNLDNTGMTSVADSAAEHARIMKEENTDESDTPRGVEQDSAIPENSMGETVSGTDGSSRVRELEREVTANISKGRTGRSNGSGIPTTSPVESGSETDTGVVEQNEQPVATAGVTGNSDPRGNSVPSGRGLQAKRAASKGVSEKIASGNKKLSERAKLQKEADNVRLVVADEQNIRDTLPLLSEPQQNDVIKTEQRLYTQGHKGMMLTNGTGTGKTYSGLGLIKRVIRGGGDVLVVSPAGVIPAWNGGAKDLGMTAHKLKNKTDKGKAGLNITSYQNFRDNQELLQRNFHLVVYDESHHLMSNMNGDETAANSVHKAMTGLEEYASIRGQMAIKDEFDQYRADADAEIKKLMDNDYDQPQAEREVFGRDEFRERYAKLQAKAKRIGDKLWKEQQEKNTKVLFLSATPFAGHKSVFYADGYLFDTKLGAKESQAYNTGSPESQYLVNNFGYRMRYNKVTIAGPEVDVGLLERDWADRMFKEGAMSGRVIELDHDYSREFVVIEKGIGEAIDNAFKTINWKAYPKLSEQLIQWRKNGADRQLTEALRVRAVIPRIKEHLKLGRKVVVFHQRQEFNISNPFDFQTPDVESKLELDRLKKNHPEIFKIDLSGLRTAPKVIGDEFGDIVGYFSGQNKSTRDKDLSDFNNDNGTKQILVIQKDAGKEGLSAHDITGKQQRALIILNTPVSPADAIQMEGRIYRHGLRSDAVIEYPTIQTSFERSQYRETVSSRTSTAENLAMGSQARGLRDAFREGYLEPSTEAPSKKQGKGGIAADRSMAEISEFDRAKTYYYRRQKKTSKNKAQEGTDYFATPEPIGFKMVEWAKLIGGERVLEPSAGHGAIARWFPESVTGVAIEQSPELVSELGIVVNGDTRHMDFEDLNIINKFHAVVMNPPFGNGGATAIKHIEKAVSHLRDGGRVIAIYPRGPAADKKFDEWYAETKGVYQVANIDLPAVTFGRAGTSVMTRIVVLDKDTRGNNVHTGMTSRDFTNITDINELFDRIKDMDLPDRPDVKVSAADAGMVARDIKNEDGSINYRAVLLEYGSGKANIVGKKELKKIAERFGGEAENEVSAWSKDVYYNFDREMDRERFFAGIVDKYEMRRVDEKDAMYALAYHGSPHKFDRFTLDAIGAGLGNQAFGWGLYFAGDRAVAEYYQGSLGGLKVNGRKATADEVKAYSVLKDNNNDIDLAVFSGQIELDSVTSAVSKDALQKRQDVLESWAETMPSISTDGSLYQVDIPERDELLDWNAPLSEQPKSVKDKLDKLPKEIKSRLIGAENSFGSNRVTGEFLYTVALMDYQFGQGVPHNEAQKASSMLLNSVGIKGASYLDYGSLDGAGDTRNFVIWDDNAVTIQSVNDQIQQAQSLAKQEEVSAVQEAETKPAKGMPVEEVQRIADEFIAGLNGIQVQARIAQSQDEIYNPETLSKGLVIKGAYHNKQGLFTLVADNLKDTKDVIRTLQHEILGHYGLDTISAEDRSAILSAIAKSKTGGLKPLWDRIKGDSFYSKKTELEQAEEVLAHAAEDISGGAMQAIIDAIRSVLTKALRKIGLIRNAVTTAELRQFIREMAKGIRAGQGRQSKAGDAALYSASSESILKQKMSQWSRNFTDSALDNLNRSVGHASRETIVEMSPQQFLMLAAQLPNPDSSKMKGLEGVEKYADVPMLRFDNNGDGTATIVGHEGRHRAYKLIEQGVTSMPVRFVSREYGDGPAIRWSEFKGELPTFLIGEDGVNTVPFPDSLVYPKRKQEQKPQTETESFKRWFGDSKVVDENGEPLVVYHGTMNNDFDVFKPSGEQNLFGRGDQFYFTDDANEASGYAIGNADQKSKGRNGSGSVMPVYLSMKNPANLTADNFNVNDIDVQSYIESLDMDGLLSAIKDAGYDGVIYDGDIAPIPAIGTHYVVFEPNQIKSAIGNRGTFDATDPSIMYSLDSAPTNKEVDSWFSRRLTQATPKLLATAPMDRMVEEMSRGIPSARDYMRMKRDMDAYRNQKHAKYDEVAQRWLKFNTLHPKQAKTLASLMHESTIAQVDPSKKFEEFATGADKGIAKKSPDSEAGQRAQVAIDNDAARQERYDELKKLWNTLDKEGQSLYRVVRDTYIAQSQELDQILMTNLEKSLDIQAERAKRKFDEEIQRITDEGLKGAERDEAIAKAEKKYKAAATKMRWNKAARLTMLRQQFEGNRLKGPYFPLARFGNYFVTARNDEGEVQSFSLFETPDEQQRFAKEMESDGYDVEVGFLSDGDALRRSVDPNFLADVEEILSESGVGDSVKDQVWQRYLETMPDMSLRKRFIHRKGRKGYNLDALRAFGSNMFHAAHQMARLKYGADMTNAIEKAKAEVKTTSDPVRSGMLVNEIEKRNDYVMNPKGSAWAQTLTSAAFVYYLSVTPAAAAVNASQTVIMGVPILGNEFGYGKTQLQLMKAVKDFTAGRGRIDNTKLTAGERDAINRAYDMGLIDKTQAHDLAGVGETGVEYSPVRTKVMAGISFLFHHTERFNREVTFMAAYRMAIQKGMSQDAAIEKAADLTWKTHFDYSNTNRPRFMHGDPAKVLFVFRNYNINMLYRLFRDAHQMFNGESKEVRREALKQLGGITAMMALNAGIKGTWMFGIAMMFAGLFFDEPEEELKKAVVETLGPTAGGMLLNGIPAHMTGIQLSTRIGMPDLWFRSPDRQLEGKDEYSYWLAQIAGAVPSIAERMFMGVSMIKDGNTYRGFETMSPKFMRDLMRSYRYSAEGVNTMKGEPVVGALTPEQILFQAIGFTPAVIAERYETNSWMKNREQRVMNDRGKVLLKMYLAIKNGDDQGYNEAYEDIQEYNKKYPKYPLDAKAIRRSLQSRARSAQRMENGLYLNPRLAPDIRESTAPMLYEGKKNDEQ